MMNKEKFFGFYLFPNFLLNINLKRLIDDFKKLKEDDTKLKNISLKKITTEKRKIVFKKTFKQHKILISGDGLIQYRDDNIETKVDKENTDCNSDLSLSLKYTYEAWAEYLKRCNLLFFLIDCSCHKLGVRNDYRYEFSELTKNNSIIRTCYTNNKLTNGTDYSWNSLYFFANNQINCFIKDVNYNFATIDLSIFSDAWKYFETIIVDKDFSNDCCILSKSLSEFNLKNHNTSFLLSWIFIEQYIFENWKKLILNNTSVFYEEAGIQKTFTIKKLQNFKTKIQNNQGITARPMIKHLKTNEIKKIPEYSKIEIINNVRDKIVHNNYKCTHAENKEILEYTKLILNEKYGLFLNFRTDGLSLHGL